MKPDVNSVGFHPHLSHKESIPIAMVTLGLKHSAGPKLLPARRKGDAERPHKVKFLEKSRTNSNPKTKCFVVIVFCFAFSGYDNCELTKKF